MSDHDSTGRLAGVLQAGGSLAALLAGVAVRLLHLGAAPLWFDEVITADWVARPWPEMLGLCVADNHPPLSFAVAKLAHDLLGDAAWALRLPSAVLGAERIVRVLRGALVAEHAA